MKLFPEPAYVQLEFDKIKNLLLGYCLTEFAKTKAEQLRRHTQIEFIEIALRQSYTNKQLLQNTVCFPDDPVLNFSKELKLLSIPEAALSGEPIL